MTVMKRIQTDGSHGPLHLQIAQILTMRLEAGEWSTASPPATEQSLCREFGVSRTTVRQALSRLKQAGLLESRPGVGTRGVASAVKRRVAGSASDLLHASLDTRSRVVELGDIASPLPVASFFGIAPGDPVWHFVRVHSLNARALSVVDSYLPVEFGRGFARTALKRPMHELLWQRFGLRQARSVHTIRVARADVDVATLLGVALASPVLRVQSRIYLADGSPVRWVENSFREDGYEYVAEVEWPAPSSTRRSRAKLAPATATREAEKRPSGNRAAVDRS
jgi:DNA-binding GntR family transcriptional regulator